MKQIYLIGVIITVSALLLFALGVAADRSQIEHDAKPVANKAPGNSPNTAPAQPQANVVMDWHAFSSGGGRQTSVSFDMNTTIGQTAAGEASSASYRSNAGFQQNIVSSGCCVGATGNVNMAGIVDVADLSALVSYLTGGGYVLPCVEEANVNGAGIVDLGDLSALVSYLTGGGFVLPNCS